MRKLWSKAINKYQPHVECGRLAAAFMVGSLAPDSIWCLIFALRGFIGDDKA
jgi:hypothetical protein